MGNVYEDKQFLQPNFMSDDCQLKIEQDEQDKKCKSCVKRLHKFSGCVEHLDVINTSKVIEKVKQTHSRKMKK